MAKELEIPGPALSDPNATEIARVWVAHKGQHVSLSAGRWEDPGAWGVVLADLTQHLANAYVQERGMAREHVVARIIELMNAELERPTDNPVGQVVPPTQ